VIARARKVYRSFTDIPPMVTLGSTAPDVEENEPMPGNSMEAG